ncbi:MAG TPA: ATP-grasp domain-containing protein [Streptomyces sp.]
MVLGGRANVVEAAHDADVSVVWLHQPGSFDDQVRKICERVVEIDLADVAAVERTVEDLHGERAFDLVISLTEECLLMAARLNERLGLGGNTVRTVTLLKDKALMRRRLAEVGLSPVRSQVVTDAGALTRFMARVAGPVVLKPSTGAGSVQVFRLESPEQAEQVWSRLAAGGGPVPAMLAEEFLTGREISVEAFSHQGVHTVVATTDKTLTENFVEVGHTIPAALDDDTFAEVAGLVTAFLDTVGLTVGPSHTEVKLTPAGPRIVESHNRIGGGSLNDLIRLARGVDFARLSVTVPLGLETVPQPPYADRGAAVRFVQPPAGVVRGVHGEREAAAVEGAELRSLTTAGAVVPPLRSSLDRVNGYVVASGRDAAEAVRRCEQVLRTVQVDTEPLPGQGG